MDGILEGLLSSGFMQIDLCAIQVDKKMSDGQKLGPL
jgi:hypothetical protein